MKKIAIVLIMMMFLCSCGKSKVIDGVTYETYGFINATEKRHDNIEYALITGNIIWAILLSESIVMPIYFTGFSLYQPIGKKKEKI